MRPWFCRPRSSTCRRCARSSRSVTLPYLCQHLYFSISGVVWCVVLWCCSQIAAQIALALRISGPFNIQLLAKDNMVKVRVQPDLPYPTS